MPSKSQFWCIFNGFLEGKWRHIATKIKEKLIQIAKSDFLINRALAAAGAWFLRVQGSKLAPKINQKSTKNWSPRWIASWHRFLMDFGGFWEASWDAKSSQERKKIDWKTHRKNDEKKMRFGSAQGGWVKGRATVPQGFWDPLITNSQTTAHRPQEQLVTPCAQARWRILIIKVWIIRNTRLIQIKHKRTIETTFKY